MSLLQVNKNPSPRDLVWFGAIAVAFLLGLGAFVQWRWQAAAAAWSLGIGAAVWGALYAAIPAIRRPCYLGLSYATAPIGWVLSLVLLLLVYYVVLTPIGLVLRLVGYDPMARKSDRAARSYWVSRPEKPRRSRYFRQY